MATPSNIDVFNETVGKTFAFLYESFPRKVTIDVCALTGVSAPTFEEKDRRSESKNMKLLFFVITPLSGLLLLVMYLLMLFLLKVSIRRYLRLKDLNY